MSSKNSMKRKNDAIVAALPVKGVAKVDIRGRSAKPRTCSSHACEDIEIRVGDPYARVLYELQVPVKPPEDFHHECYRWEFEQ